MQRRLAVCVAFAAIGFACCYAQNPKQVKTSKTTDVAALQRKRIELLETRVKAVDSLVDMGLVDRTEVVRMQMDVISARLDYADSNVEKRKLLDDLIAKYDELIKVSEAMALAAVLPTQPGQRVSNSQVKAATDLLLLKAERVRIEIERESLD